MEYVAAPSLADLLERRGTLRAARVATIGAQIAEGLAAMHRCGIVHRDVKPANVMVGPGDAVTVTDFGIAIIHADLGEDDHLVAGTPHYMAPELACGDVPSAAADMYSLGATLYAALEGAPPRPGAGHVLDVPSGVGAEAVRPARRNERLDALLNTLLDLDPQRRPSAAAAARLLADARGADAADDATTRSSPRGALHPVDHGGADARGRRRMRGVARRRAASVGAGRHRAALAARWRPSRRVVAVGAGLVGVLGMAGFLTLTHEPAPAPPVASPVLAPASAPPSAGPPIVPVPPSTATSTPVEEVASAAPPSSVSSRGSTAQAAGSGGDDLRAPRRGSRRRARGQRRWRRRGGQARQERGTGPRTVAGTAAEPRPQAVPVVGVTLRGLAGWNSSTRLPWGSAISTWRPPGPATRSLANGSPAARRRVISASRSSTTRWMRLPPGVEASRVSRGHRSSRGRRAGAEVDHGGRRRRRARRSCGA